MITITTAGGDEAPRAKRNAIPELTVAEIADGTLQEGQSLDFKRAIDLDKPETKPRFLDDVVAFLNRGPGRIIIGVEEKAGKFAGFRVVPGDPDKMVLRLQSMIQDGVSPTPLDVEVVALSVDGGFIVDVRLPRHPGGPFMNRATGSYLIRSGARNLPIDPGMLRSRFVDELVWMRTLDEMTAAEDARLADGKTVALGRSLRIGILPQEHFDHRLEPFSQDDHVRSSAPTFHEHSRGWFKVCEDGHQVMIHDLRSQGIERLFIRDDWFIHAHVAYALQEKSGEGRLAIYEFDRDVARYLKELSEFLEGRGIMGPFAITLALQSLGEAEHFHAWFPDTSAVRTLRPRLVPSVDDQSLITEFLRRVRQASRLG